MRLSIFLTVAFAVWTFTPTTARSQSPPITRLEAVSVDLSMARIGEKTAIRVTKDPAIQDVDEPTFAKLKDVKFNNGTIEVRVRSRLLKDAPELARGFIGVAFRIDPQNRKFECLYLRPTNGRAAVQLRRNRSTQYFSYPDFKFDRLRKEAPGEYESYVDIRLDEWITMRIEVQGRQACLFVNNASQPVLIVNDLKHGPDLTGGIGLWVDVGTEGYFADLKIDHARN